MNRFAVLLATCGYIGAIPFAPGTFGSIPGLLLALWLHHLGIWQLEAAVIVIIFVIGAWAATKAEEHYGLIDPGPVVIDEVLGMLVTLAFLPVSLTGAIVGFVVFRVCDVIKPPPARQLEQLHGGWGVMSDDFMAGVWGLVITRLLAWLFPAWMLL